MFSLWGLSTSVDGDWFQPEWSARKKATHSPFVYQTENEINKEKDEKSECTCYFWCYLCHLNLFQIPLPAHTHTHTHLFHLLPLGLCCKICWTAGSTWLRMGKEPHCWIKLSTEQRSVELVLYAALRLFVSALFCLISLLFCLFFHDAPFSFYSLSLSFQN